MINNHAMTDDKTAVERWENEGGRTSPSAAGNEQFRVFSRFSSFDLRRRSNDSQAQVQNRFSPAA